jgi:hypothetical protein
MKMSAQGKVRARNRPNARRRANGNVSSGRRTRASESRITLPLPPGSEKVIALVREELEQLMRRWKKLLPRLQQINDSRRRRRS